MQASVIATATHKLENIKDAEEIASTSSVNVANSLAVPICSTIFSGQAKMRRFNISFKLYVIPCTS
ncbi:hypothetical protein DSM106972_086370 [Dulcicalothrix desertica PCC 7102]|uniref:Uncharacterized protein n=1 Tax=Dulcicalothrix desertica PCC 7102 TaxID=232991 RepID=A0A3S1C430_9CYAN|nr:hypothetical protein DSM106972_086370 [Dulcicalothrix desertica PCC 7102]